MRSASGTHRLDDGCIDAVALLGEFSDHSQCLGVGGDQFVAADAVCPMNIVTSGSSVSKARQ